MPQLHAVAHDTPKQGVCWSREFRAAFLCGARWRGYVFMIVCDGMRVHVVRVELCSSPTNFA